MDNQTKLLPSYNYLNSYETAKRYLQTNPAFSNEEWNTQMQRGTLDSYIAVVDNIKNEDEYEAIRAQIPNFEYLDEDSKFMAIYNNYYSDNETKKSQTYSKLNTETNQYEEVKNDFTDKEWTLKLLQDEANYNYEQAMAEIYEENRKNKNWVGKAVGQVEAAGRGVASGLINVAGNLLNIVQGIGEAIYADVTGGDPDEAWRNAMKTRETDIAVKGLENIVYNFEKEVGLRSYDGNLIHSAQFVNGLGESYGAIMPSIAIWLGITIATGGAGAGSLTGTAATVVNAFSKVAKVYNALYWTSMAAGNMNEMLNNPETASISTSNIIANSITKTAFEFAIEKGLDAILGSSLLDNIRYGWSTNSKFKGINNILAKAPSGVRVAARFAGDAVHEGLEELLQEFSGWFTDQVFSIWDEKFLNNSNWNAQVAWDAFLGGVIMSLIGANFKLFTTKNIVVGIDENGKAKKLNKIKSLDYILTMDELSNTINTIDFENMTVEERTSAIAGIYTSLRQMSAIFEAMGSERVQNMFTFLSELRDRTAYTFDTKSLSEQQAELETKVNDFVSNLALESKYNAKMVEKIKEELKEQNIKEAEYVVNDTMTDDEFKEVSGHEAEAFKRLMESTDSKQVVISTTGKAPLKIDDIIVVPKEAFESLTSDNVVKEIACMDNVIKIQDDTKFSAALDIIVPLYNKFIGKKQSKRQAIVALMQNPEFVKIALYQGNKTTLRFIEDLKRLSDSIDTKSLLGAKQKLDLESSYKMMSEVLTQYYIDQQTAPSSTYETSALLSAEQKEYIRNQRWSNDLANRIKQGIFNPLSKRSENDVRLLVQRVENSNMSTENKKFCINTFTKSTDMYAIRKAFSLLEERYYYMYNSKYDNKTYFKNTTMAEIKANSFLENNNITIQSLLSNKYIGEQSAFDYYNNLFTEATYNTYTFVKDDKNNIIVKALENIQVAKPEISNTLELESTAQTLANSNLVNNDMLNDNSKRYASITTINDLIYEPELLNDDIKNKILEKYNNLRPDSVFKYLRTLYINNSEGLINIRQLSDGTFTFFNISNATNMIPDKSFVNNDIFDTIRTKQKTEKSKVLAIDTLDGYKYAVYRVGDILNKEYANKLPNDIKNSLIYLSDRTDNKASKYYGVLENRIVIDFDFDNYLDSKFDTIIDSKFDTIIDAFYNDIIHEVGHLIDSRSGIELGIQDNDTLTNFTKTNRNKIINDLESHVPDLFKNSKDKMRQANAFLYIMSTSEGGSYGIDIQNEYMPFITKIVNGKRLIITPWNSVYNLDTNTVTISDVAIHPIFANDIKISPKKEVSLTNETQQVSNEDIKQYITTHKGFAKEYAAINNKIKEHLIDEANLEFVSKQLGISIDELNKPTAKTIDVYREAMGQLDFEAIDEAQYNIIVDEALHINELYKRRKLISQAKNAIIAERATEIKTDIEVNTKVDVDTKAKAETKKAFIPRDIKSILTSDIKQYLREHKDLNKKRNSYATKTTNKYYLTTYKMELGKIQQFMRAEVGISETDFKTPTKSVISEFKEAMNEKIKNTTDKKKLNIYSTMLLAGTEYLTNRFNLLKFNTEIKQQIANDPDFVRTEEAVKLAEFANETDETIFDSLQALPLANPLKATAQEIKKISDSRYVSNEKAKGTLLEYYIDKNKPIYMDPNLQTVILAASSIRNKLDSEFVNRITDKNHEHRLRTKSDLYNYVMNNNMNEATFDLLNRYYFKNENITSYPMLLALVNNAEKFYALRAALNALQKESKVDIQNYLFDPNLVTNFKQIITMIKEKMPKTYELYTQIRDRYEGKSGNIHDVNRKYLQIILLNHFDGSLYSAGGAAAMAKILAWGKYKAVGEVTGDKSFDATIKGAKADDDSNRTIAETIADTDLAPGDEDIFGFVYLNKDRYTKQRQLFQNKLDEYAKNISKNSFSRKAVQEFMKEQVNEISNLTDAELDRQLSASENKAITEVDTGSYITRRNIQQNIQQKAYRILAHLQTDLSPNDYKRLIATYPDLGFKEDGTWSMPNKGTETYTVTEKRFNEESGEMESVEVEKTRTQYLYGDDLADLSDKLSQVSTLLRQGYFQGKSFAKLVNIINKQKAQLKRLTRKSITKVVEDVNIGKQVYSVEGEGPMPTTFKELMSTTFDKLAKTKGKGLYFDERHTVKQYKIWLEQNAETLNNLTAADANELLKYCLTAKPYDTSFGSDDIKMFMATKIFLYQYLGQLKDLDIDQELLLQNEKSLQVEQQLAGLNLTLIANAMRQVNPAEVIYRQMASKLAIEFSATDIAELTSAVKQYAEVKDNKQAQIMLSKIDDIRNQMYQKAIKQYKGINRNLLDQLWKAQRMFMLSAPGTWIRNITSNALVKVSNDATSIIGDFVWKPLNTLADKIKAKLKKKYIAPTKIDTADYKQGLNIARSQFDYSDVQDGDYLSNARKSLNTAQNTFYKQVNFKNTNNTRFNQEIYNNSKLAVEAIEEDIKYYTKLSDYNKKVSSTPLRKTLTNQYQIVGTKVSNETKAFIDTVIIRSGLLDSIKSGLNKYDSNLKLTGNDNQLVNMIIKNIQIEILQNNQFNSELFNKTSKLLYKVLSDDPFVNKKFISYLGKILTEQNVDISSNTLTNNIIQYVADAYSMAAYDYMHRPNFVNAIEKIVRERTGKVGYFAYKQLFPFANASWNWFVEGLNYTPVGLAKAVYDFAKLEKVVNKLDFSAAKGEGPSGRFASYIVKRNIGKGVIGSIGLLIGGLLGSLGIAQIDEDDYDKKVKLRIGDAYIDISQIYGTTGIGLGMTIASAFKKADTDFFDVLNTTLNVMFEESVFADVANLFTNNKGFGEAMLYEANGILSTFVPNIVKTFTSSLYAHKIKYSSGFLGSLQKFAVQSIPGIAYAMPKQYDPFTGELQYKYGGANIGTWLAAATSKLTPIKIEPRKISEAEKICISLGFNKGELTGKYDFTEFNDKDTATLNSIYGQFNKNDLNTLLSNSKKYKVLDKKTGKYIEVMFNKMTDAQKESVIKRIMNDNAKYAKVKVWTSNGHKYYAESDSEYQALLQKGITRNVYRPKKGNSYVD